MNDEFDEDCPCQDESIGASESKEEMKGSVGLCDTKDDLADVRHPSLAYQCAQMQLDPHFELSSTIAPPRYRPRTCRRTSP